MTTARSPHRHRALLALAAIGVVPLAVTAMPRPTPAAGGAPPVALRAPAALATAPLDTAVLAGGCFWGMELVYEHVRGVVSVVSGFAGGGTDAPSYEQVSGGRTGHAESVRIVYDPSVLSYADILRVFFSAAHDPTQKDRQGPDVGPQYRSAILFMDAGQERDAREYIRQLTASRYFPRPIVTEIAPLGAFHEAESYHQDYAVLHPEQPYIVINDLPRLERLRTRLPQLYTTSRAP
ncbi:MAG: peptide-methionine (S)-S-oxide reductase MsrA [Gemmatimonadaceae bacterium]